MRSTTGYAAAAIVIGLHVATTAWSQPADQEHPPPPPAGAGGDRPPLEELPPEAQRERAREFMTRRLERMQRDEQALREALAMLDRGEPMERVRAKAGEPFAERREGRQGPGRVERPGLPGGGPPRPREGPPGGPEGGPGPGGPPQVSEETMLEVIKEVFPGAHDRLQRLRTEDPDQFRAMLERMRPRVGQFIRWRMEDPEIWKLRAEVFRRDREADQLAERAAFGSESEREQATDRLRALLNNTFDLHQQIAESDVKRLGTRVEKLRAEIAERGANREQFVENRVSELIEQASERTPRRDGPGPDRDGPPPGERERPPAPPR